MNNLDNPFGKAGAFFGSAFRDMTQASEFQERMQRSGLDNTRYEADADQSYMYGAVPPQTGTYGVDQGPADDTESVKRELLASAKQQRSSNGHIAVRASGGINTAVKR